MKNISNIIFVVAFLSQCFFFSCTKDDDGEIEQNVTITPVSITIYHDDTWTLSATNAKSWTSDDNFVAEVDENGIVTGGHVGTTIITAKNSTSYASCKVTIVPRYDLYDTPILDWGATMSSIQFKETHIESSSSSSNTTLSYNYSKNGTPCALLYRFEEGKLSRIVVLMKLIEYVNAAEYLEERYVPLYAEKKDYFLMFADAYTKDKIKTIVGIQTTIISGTELTMVTYAPAN